MSWVIGLAIGLAIGWYLGYRFAVLGVKGLIEQGRLKK